MPQKLRCQVTEILSHGEGIFPGRAGGHIQLHLEFRLIVEGQHLDLHLAVANQRGRGHQHDHHAAEERPARAGGSDQATGDGPVHAGPNAFRPGFGVGRGIIRYGRGRFMVIVGGMQAGVVRFG